jgi:hypothetical protein
MNVTVPSLWLRVSTVISYTVTISLTVRTHLQVRKRVRTIGRGQNERCAPFAARIMWQVCMYSCL